MLLEIQEADEPRAFRLIGEMDISNAETLAALLEKDAEGEGDIILDLSGLTFIDSSGIRVLLRAMDRLDGRGRIVLKSPTRSVRHVLSMMGLEDRGPIIIEAEGPTEQ